ncbi:MAG: hypothetical protein P4N59_09565, partial [Negativicutes bacterium]|nr:hypothetical protein [Negativicutes bacterium]
MFTPTAPYIPTASSTGSTAQLRGLTTDVLSLKQSRAITDVLLGSPTSAATPLEIVKRDDSGKAALTTLETLNIASSNDSGGILNASCNQLAINSLDLTKQVTFDMANGIMNLGSTGTDPVSICAT